MLILDNATLADLERGEMRPGHFVTIDGDVIVDIAEKRPVSDCAERMDLEGRLGVIAPGAICRLESGH